VNAPKRVFNDHIEYGHYVNRTAIGPLAAANRRSCLVATDLRTEHGGTDANKRDGARRLGRLNVDDLQL